MSLLNSLIDTRPLRASRDFRRLWLGRSLSTFGAQLTLVAVLHQVWVISGSSLAVGAIGLAHAIPMITLGMVGGALADRLDRRRLVLAAQSGQTIASALLAVQAIAGFDSLPVVLGLVTLQSTFGAFAGPAGLTFIPRLLPKEQVSAGIALTHSSAQVAMLLGPAAAGAIIAQWGVDVCYIMDAATFLVALYCVLRLPPMRPEGDGPPRPTLHAIWEGLTFIAHRPVIRGALLTDVIATLMAMPIALFPAINEERFGGRPETLGMMMSAIAVGGVAATVMSGNATKAKRPGLVMLVAASIWGIGWASFGLAGSVWLALGSAALAGAADTMTVISRATIIQVATPDSHRGRVNSVNMIVGFSGPDIGNFRGGLVASATSAPIALVSGGLLCVAGIGAVALRNKPLRRFTLER